MVLRPYLRRVPRSATAPLSPSATGGSQGDRHGPQCGVAGRERPSPDAVGAVGATPPPTADQLSRRGGRALAIVLP